MKNNKGFTLMEMLIVVAIIAILVAIAIPTFSGALTKAREAADVANLRAAYAQAMVDNMVNEEDFPDAYPGTPALNYEDKADWEVTAATDTTPAILTISYEGDFIEDFELSGESMAID